MKEKLNIVFGKMMYLFGVAIFAIGMFVSVNTATVTASVILDEAPCPQWCPGGTIECGQSQCGPPPLKYIENSNLKYSLY